MTVVTTQDELDQALENTPADEDIVLRNPNPASTPRLTVVARHVDSVPNTIRVTEGVTLAGFDPDLRVTVDGGRYQNLHAPSRNVLVNSGSAELTIGSTAAATGGTVRATRVNPRNPHDRSTLLTLTGDAQAETAAGEVNALGRSRVTASGSTHVNADGDAAVDTFGDATFAAHGNVIVRAHDRSRGNLYGSSSAYGNDHATIGVISSSATASTSRDATVLVADTVTDVDAAVDAHGPCETVPEADLRFDELIRHAERLGQRSADDNAALRVEDPADGLETLCRAHPDAARRLRRAYGTAREAMLGRRVIPPVRTALQPAEKVVALPHAHPDFDAGTMTLPDGRVLPRPTDTLLRFTHRDGAPSAVQSFDWDRQRWGRKMATAAGPGKALLDETVLLAPSVRTVTTSTAAAYGQACGACLMCSRPLSDPRSRERGYGSECAKSLRP